MVCLDRSTLLCLLRTWSKAGQGSRSWWRVSLKTWSWRCALVAKTCLYESRYLETTLLYKHLGNEHAFFWVCFMFFLLVFVRLLVVCALILCRSIPTRSSALDRLKCRSERGGAAGHLRLPLNLPELRLVWLDRVPLVLVFGCFLGRRDDAHGLLIIRFFQVWRMCLLHIS